MSKSNFKNEKFNIYAVISIIQLIEICFCDSVLCVLFLLVLCYFNVTAINFPLIHKGRTEHILKLIFLKIRIKFFLLAKGRFCILASS